MEEAQIKLPELFADLHEPQLTQAGIIGIRINLINVLIGLF